MPKLKLYDVTIDGNRTTMKLTPDEAERLGATQVGTKKKASSASSKKRSAKNKSAGSESS